MLFIHKAKILHKFEIKVYKNKTSFFLIYKNEG